MASTGWGPRIPSPDATPELAAAQHRAKALFKPQGWVGPRLLLPRGAHVPPCPQAWERLEKAEHERELALRNELIRQEKLEQLAARFDRKAAMRETWLSENQRLVSQVSCWEPCQGLGSCPPGPSPTAGLGPDPGEPPALSPSPTPLPELEVSWLRALPALTPQTLHPFQGWKDPRTPGSCPPDPTPPPKQGIQSPRPLCSHHPSPAPFLDLERTQVSGLPAPPAATHSELGREPRCPGYTSLCHPLAPCP